MLWAFPQDAMGFPSGCYGRREEFRQVARLPADGIRSDARGEVNNHVEVGTACPHCYTGGICARITQLIIS